MAWLHSAGLPRGLLAVVLGVGACTGTGEGGAPAPVAADRAVTAAAPDPYQLRITAVRQRIATAGVDTRFHFVVEPPFVIIGDQAAAVVQEHARGTVRWAVQRLRAAYFERDPDQVLEIWLLSGQHSYRRHARALFGDQPDTPYGYFSPEHDALIMNIATGGGTLVHEIVHPFMRANFPDCPTWFNEGLGALYEQSSERDGHIVGLPNWRLAGLKDALRAGRVPSFAALTATTDHEFYDRDPGTHYAQARYLLYYLQERGLLRDYFRRFRDNRQRDPTGYQTLHDVLGKPDMDAFFAEWRAFVLGLELP